MYREALYTIRNLFVFNLFLIVAVFYIGFELNSIALIAFATDKALDSASNLISFVGIYFASQKPDYDHLYGHSKFEVLGRFVVSLVLFLSIFQIILNSVNRLISGTFEIELSTSELIILASIDILLLLEGYYSKIRGKKTNIRILELEAYNYFNDTLAMIIIIVGLFLSKFGLYFIDPLLALGFAALILKLGWEIFRESVDILTDKAIIPPDKIRELALGTEGVIDCYEITTRTDGVGVFLECSIAVEPDLKVSDAHKIADIIENKIKTTFTQHVFKKITIHIEPAETHGNTNPSLKPKTKDLKL